MNINEIIKYKQLNYRECKNMPEGWGKIAWDSYLKICKKAIKEEKTFDIIFMDPPYKLYNTKRLFKIQETVNNASLLLPAVVNPNTKKFKGAIIIKHPRRYPIDKLELDNIKKIETFDFGLNAISFFIVKPKPGLQNS